ncbi:MAG: hypothetical protein ACKO5E_22535 [bacterium]
MSISLDLNSLAYSPVSMTPTMEPIPAYVYVCTTIDLKATSASERPDFFLSASFAKFNKPKVVRVFRPPCSDHPAGGIIAFLFNSLEYLNFLEPNDAEIPEIRFALANAAISAARLNLALPAGDLKDLIQIAARGPLKSADLRSAVLVILDNSLYGYSSQSMSKILLELNACGFSEKEIDFALQRFIKAKWQKLNYFDLLQLAKAARVASLKWPSIYGRMTDLLKKEEYVPVESVVEGVRQAALTKLFHDCVLEHFEYCKPIFFRNLQSLRVANVAEVFRSYGTLHQVNGLTFQMLDLIRQSTDQMSYKDIKRTLSGLAELGIHDDNNLDPLCCRLLEIATSKKIEERDLIKIIWCLAVTGGNRRVFPFWGQLEDLKPSRLKPEVMRLLYQSALLSGLELPGRLNQETVRAEARKWCRKANLPNDFELSVGREIRRHGVRFKFGQSECGVEIDMVIRKGDLPPVAVFCDGVRYHHINQLLRYGLSGPDKMAVRLLSSNGFKVVRIPDVLWRQGRHERGWLYRFFICEGGVNLEFYKE